MYDRENDTITIVITNVKARARAATPTSKGDNMLLANVNQVLDIGPLDNVAGGNCRVMVNAIFKTPDQAAAKAAKDGPAPRRATGR